MNEKQERCSSWSVLSGGAVRLAGRVESLRMGSISRQMTFAPVYFRHPVPIGSECEHTFGSYGESRKDRCLYGGTGKNDAVSMCKSHRTKHELVRWLLCVKRIYTNVLNNRLPFSFRQVYIQLGRQSFIFFL